MMETRCLDRLARPSPMPAPERVRSSLPRVRSQSTSIVCHRSAGVHMASAICAGFAINLLTNPLWVSRAQLSACAPTLLGAVAQPRRHPG